MARKTLGGALDGDVNLKIGILMMIIFLAGFIGSNCAGLLVDFCGGLKIIGIFAISAGKLEYQKLRNILTTKCIQYKDTQGSIKGSHSLFSLNIF